MRRRVLVTAQAKDDLREIRLYIAQDDRQAANRLIKTIRDKLQLLCQQPGVGRTRDELRPGLRSFPVGRYVIFYKPAEGGIEVLRVLSAYRDVDTEL